jgi:hypothetical protein
MKLLHRLLATAGLAALIGPQAAMATAPDGLELGQKQQAPAGITVAAAQGFTPAVPTPVDLADLEAALPVEIAAAMVQAPPGARPEQVAAEVASRIARRLAQAGLSLDLAAQANLASEIVAQIERAYAAQGVRVDRIAVASATLSGMSAAGKPAGSLGRATAAIGKPGSARDISQPDGSGRNSAY